MRSYVTASRHGRTCPKACARAATHPRRTPSRFFCLGDRVHDLGFKLLKLVACCDIGIYGIALCLTGSKIVMMTFFEI